MFKIDAQQPTTITLYWNLFALTDSKLWSLANHSNIYRRQTLQSLVLLFITNATSLTEPKSNFYSRSNLCSVQEASSRLYAHSNPSIDQLSSLSHPYNPNRRLKRRWHRDLLAVTL